VIDGRSERAASCGPRGQGLSRAARDARRRHGGDLQYAGFKASQSADKKRPWTASLTCAPRAVKLFLHDFSTLEFV
jgi:hypothetical protein